MSRSYKSATAAAVVLAASVVAPAAHADERICRGTLGPITVVNLRVADNASCTLNGTKVQGNIVVGFNSTLTTRRVMVIGNVQAENSKQVNVLESSRIGGSVQVKQGGGARVTDSIVDSDIQFDSNAVYVRALRNTVGGSIQVFSNTGGVEIRRNVVDGNLQCKSNVPAPIGGANTVQGNKEDQCARL